MQLFFSDYDATTKQLRFQIVCSPETSSSRFKQAVGNFFKKTLTEKDKLGALKQKLLYRFSEHLKIPFKVDESNCHYIVSSCTNIRYLLFETKQIFLTSGITPKNWQDFIASVEKQLNIKLANENKLSLANTAEEILPEINKFLGVQTKSRFLQINKYHFKHFYKPQQLLLKYFPKTYKLLEHNGLSTKDYTKIFLDRYNRTNNSKQKILFIEGDIPAIRQTQFNFLSLVNVGWQVLDQNLLYLAKQNQQQSLLNYCYNKIILPYYTNTPGTTTRIDYVKFDNEMNLLSWAVACFQPLEKISRILIETKKSSSTGIINYQAPLSSAIKQNYLEAVNFFLGEITNSPNVANTCSEVFLVALENNRAESAQLLLQQEFIKFKETPLPAAVRMGDVKIIKLLLERKDIDPNKPDRIGNPPLHEAIRSKNPEIIKLLLEENRINPNCVSKFGHTPLDIAARLNDTTPLKLLLEEKRIDPNIKNGDGLSPLHVAATHQLEAVKLLCERDSININHYDEHKYFETPLNLALKYYDNKKVLPIIRYLISHIRIVSDYFQTRLRITSDTYNFIENQIGTWLQKNKNIYNDSLSPLVKYFKTNYGYRVFHAFNPYFKDCLCTYGLIVRYQDQSTDLIKFLDELVKLNTATTVHKTPPSQESFVRALLLTKDRLIEASIANDLKQSSPATSSASFFNHSSDEKIEMKQNNNTNNINSINFKN